MMSILAEFINKYPEAFFVLLGTTVGTLVTSTVPFIQSWYLNRKDREKHAHYLAIRVVIALRQYLYKCWLVTQDDGLAQGQRDSDGCLVPQAKDPGPIVYPEDIDWKSIDPKLAYKLLSLQPSAESADRMISAAIEFGDGPPDYKDIFEERHLQYSMIGLKVLALENELCKANMIPKEDSLEDWNPSEAFQKTIQNIEASQVKRTESQRKIMDELGNPKRGSK